MCNFCYQGLIFAYKFKQKYDRAIQHFGGNQLESIKCEDFESEHQRFQYSDGNQPGSMKCEDIEIERQSQVFLISPNDTDIKQEAIDNRVTFEVGNKTDESWTEKKNKVRPFSCNICGRKFQLKGLIQQHVERHEAKRKHKYRCKECGFKFLVKTHLVEHICSNRS